MWFGNPYVRLSLLLAFLFGVFGFGTIVLVAAVARIERGAATTYGESNASFEASWGSRLSQAVPVFALRHTWMVDSVEKEVRALRPHYAELPLVPRSADFDVTLEHGSLEHGWLTFQAFTARQRAVFVVENTTSHAGGLRLTMESPDGAALAYDYRVAIDTAPVKSPVLGEAATVVASMLPGESHTIAIDLSTHGTDSYRLRLSDWSKVIVPRVRAQLSVNTDQFALVNFGLPHTRTHEGGTSTVVYELADFASRQDAGVTFVADTQSFALASDLVTTSPAGLALFLLGALVWAQVRGVAVHPFHYALLGMVYCFYFLFLAYLIRYVGLGPAFVVSEALTLLAFAVTIMPLFDRGFSTRTLLPLLVVLTLGFSMLFLIPAFKGVALLSFFFLTFLAFVGSAARSDRGSWPLFR